VKISVVEPPPPSKPPAAFDSAKFSFLTAITESSGRWQIWVTIRTEGRVVKLFEGEKISIGSIQGTISRIDTAQAEIKTDDGRVIVVVLGKSLRPDQTTPLGSAN
jgi:hypothetical protein